jgi:hypothetical protein
VHCPIGLDIGAETPAEIQQTLARAARQESPSFAGFSAPRGAAFFTATQGREWSCASCHGQDPTKTGRHVKTDKPIQPLAPAANAGRFTRPDKVEKWFRRNCNDVLGRACSASEKGDVLAWLMSSGK